MTKRKREEKTPDLGVEYYKILEVNKHAKDNNVKRAYRRLAMKWHPDKNLTNKDEAESQFKKISEAYQVLNDSQNRAIYDQYGEKGLKGHVPSLDAASSSGGTTFFSTGDIPTSFQFNPRSAYEKNEGIRRSGDMRWGFFFGANMFRFRYFRERGGRVHMSQGGLRKAAPIENKLPCTLEEIYKGTTIKMKISREIVDASG